MSGFIDPRAATQALRRYMLRQRLADVQNLLASLLDRLDQASQADRDRITAIVERGVQLGQGDIERRIGRQQVDLIERQDVREQELLQGADLVLQLFHSMLDAVAHGAFVSNHSDASDATSAPAAAHRLSKGRART